jgi:Activator of Hsp90 ATPase homolog 1-like protein
VYELEENDGQTYVSLSQDNNRSEEAAAHSRANWEKMLSGLKEVVETQS